MSLDSWYNFSSTIPILLVTINHKDYIVDGMRRKWNYCIFWEYKAKTVGENAVQVKKNYYCLPCSKIKI